MKKEPVRLNKKEENIIEKIKPYLTKEVMTVIIIAIIFILLIILAIACKSPYNTQFA